MDLNFYSAHLDEETGVLTAVYREIAPTDDPDPVNFIPAKQVTVTLCETAVAEDIVGPALTEEGVE